MLLYIIASILINISLTFPQQEFIFDKEINYKADFFAVDQLEYIYFVRGSELKKIDLKNDVEKNYSNTLLGKIYTIDTSDPFRTLLFYKDFNRVEFLDKNLSQIRSTISLDDLGFYNIAAVCQSVNGGFWLFDQTLNQLIYIDRNLNVAKRSNELADIIGQNTDEEQVFMLEKNDYIYLGIKGEGILLFDSYGTYLKTFPIIYIGWFQVNNEMISYYHNDKLYFYNTNNFKESNIRLPKENGIQVLKQNQRLHILTEKSLSVYHSKNL